MHLIQRLIVQNSLECEMAFKNTSSFEFSEWKVLQSGAGRQFMVCLWPQGNRGFGGIASWQVLNSLPSHQWDGKGQVSVSVKGLGAGFKYLSCYILVLVCSVWLLEANPKGGRSSWEGSPTALWGSSWLLLELAGDNPWPLCQVGVQTSLGPLSGPPHSWYMRL